MAGTCGPSAASAWHRAGAQEAGLHRSLVARRSILARRVLRATPKRAQLEPIQLHDRANPDGAANDRLHEDATRVLVQIHLATPVVPHHGHEHVTTRTGNMSPLGPLCQHADHIHVATSTSTTPAQRHLSRSARLSSSFGHAIPCVSPADGAVSCAPRPIRRVQTALRLPAARPAPGRRQDSRGCRSPRASRPQAPMSLARRSAWRRSRTGDERASNQRRRSDGGATGERRRSEIGRASCRERV